MRRWWAGLLLAPLLGSGAAVFAAAASQEARTPPRPVPAPIFPSTRAPTTTTLPATTTTLAVPVAVHNRHLEHYDIAGRTAAELHRAMEARGLVDSVDKTIGDAQTVWNISWSWRRRSAFHPRSIQVAASTNVILPRWDPPPGASPGLVRRWARYSEALRKHEDQHVAIVVRCAESIPAAVAATTSYQEADALAQAVVDRCVSENAELDRRTDHGAKDGVTL